MTMLVNSYLFADSDPGSGFSPPVVLSLSNPGAETGDASGWTAASGGSLWVSSNAITPSWPPTIDSGSRYFTAGDVANARMYQDVDVSSYATAIDAGLVVAEFDCKFCTIENYSDYLSIFLRALDSSNAVISSVAQEELNTRDLSDGWFLQDLNFLLPSGTRKIRVEIHATRVSGTKNDVHVDSMNLTLYGSTRRITPTYGSPISRGNRTSLITVTNTNLVGFGSLSGLVDGSLANNYFFNSASNDGSNWLRFDFGSGNSYVVDEFMWKQQNLTVHGVFRLEGSNDASSWTQIGSDFNLTGGLIKPGGANNVAYRYYRLRGISGSRNSGPYLYEIQFRGK